MPVTLQHERWLLDGSHVTKEAAKVAQKILSGDMGSSRYRDPLFRASGIGSCLRRQTFSRIASAAHLERREPQDGKLANIFLTGNFLHLKWQMAGLSAGYMTQVEVPVDRPELGYGGTMDAMLYDGSGFEYKSINSRGYSMVTDRYQPTDTHLKQVTAYMILADLDKFSVVYEDKNTQEWKEFRVEREIKIEESVLSEMRILTKGYTEKKLPDIIPGCLKREGNEYRNCPFRDSCLKMKEWPKDEHGDYA
jgi:hypothetical protein